MNKLINLFTRARFRFRKFANKRYSAFMSLHREVTIGKVSCHVCDLEMLKAGRRVAAALLCCVVLDANAADNDSSVPIADTDITIEEVMVVAQTAELQSQNLRVINRISAEQIKAMPVVALTDLLDYLPGIDARARGTNGTQTDISIRGGSFDQVIILLNGQNLTDAQTGHYSADLPVDIEIIDHIEVLTGTGMSQFGLSAFSGAINIVTKTLSTDGAHGLAKLEGGTYGLFHPTLVGQYAKGDFAINGSATYNQSTGYTDNTDYKIADFFLHSAINNNSGKWNIQAGAEYKGVGANSFYSLKYPDQFDATKTAFAGLDWQRSFGRFTLRASAAYRAHHDRFELYRETWQPVPADEIPSWYTGHNYHLTQTAYANFSLRYASKIGTTTAGVEVRDEHILSNVLGDARANVPAGSRFTYEKNRLNVNYFAQQTIYWHDLSVSAGVSGNWNTMFMNNLAWTVNLGYTLPHNVNLYVNANQGVRLPTFTDLYYKSATQLANPDLKPEKAITTELGLRWHNEHWAVQGAAYYRWGRNIIDWVLLPGEDKWQSRNLTAVDAAGAEAQVSYSLNEWLKRVSVSYSFCNLNKQADGFQSKYALDYLRHKLVLQINHGIWKGFGANWTLSWQQREGEYTDRDGIVQTYQPVLLFDGRVYWTNQRLTLSLDATNIIGKAYYDYGGIEQPGRWFRATAKYEF